MVGLTKPKAIVLDLEGTTTSIKFWSHSLVPFIKTHTKNCLKEKWGANEVMEVVDRLRRRTIEDRIRVPAIADESSSRNEIIQSVVDNVIVQMNLKRHGSALKQLQLIVWMYGYEKGELRGHVYNDVSTAFHNWKTKYGIKIYIYSSGLALAQKLMFSCSTKGNLTQLIDDHFDSEVMGTKTNSQSYIKIARNIQERASNILFISDNPKETRAAKVAGLKTLLVIRPANKELSDTDKEEFETINSLLEIKLTHSNFNSKHNNI